MKEVIVNILDITVDDFIDASETGSNEESEKSQ